LTAPHLDRACASAVLALVDAAKMHAPGHELAWLLGWAMRAAGEPVARPLDAPPVDPRREPSEPPVGPAHAAALARVPLTRRPT